MRGLVRSLRIFGVVLIPFIGCGDSQEEACDIHDVSCEGVVCPPDGNQCTREHCYLGACLSTPVRDGRGCTYDGLSGVCVEGVCGKNLCEGVVCDDDDACTYDDHCDYVDGSCPVYRLACNDHNECTEDGCDPADGCKWTPVEDGTLCSEGVCAAGACVLPTDACANAADLAVVCDPGFADEVGTCARDAIGDPRAMALCLVENTGVSAYCASCYGWLAGDLCYDIGIVDCTEAFEECRGLPGDDC